MMRICTPSSNYNHIFTVVYILGVRIRIMPRARYILEKQHEQSCNTKRS